LLLLIACLDAEIKAASLAQVPPTVEVDAPVEAVDEASAVETAEYPAQSDPTITNAGLTEIDHAAQASPLTNGRAAYDAQGIPQNSGFGDGAANAATEANWDNSNDLSASQEWVEVPHDATETDTGVTATAAVPSNTQSWADDQPENPAEVSICL